MSHPQDKDTLSNKLDPFLALRGLACLVVIFYHVDPPRSFIVYKNYDFSWILFGHGYAGVLVFFCLSGYLMGKAFYSGRYSLNRTGILSFWRNRILRIFPLYYFTILILAVFVYTPILQLNNWQYLFRLCTFTYNQSLPVQFSGSFWSLSTEVQFYIFAPLLYIVIQKYLTNRKQIVLAFLGVLLLTFSLRTALMVTLQAQTNYDNYIRYIYTPLITNIDVFICGFIINSWLKLEKINKFNSMNLSNKIKNLIAFILVVTLFLFTAYYHYYHKPGESVVYPVVTVIITSLFIWLFESGGHYASFHKTEKLSFDAIKRNPTRILEIVGILSYGLYLWHQAVLAKITTIISSTNPLEVFVLKLIGTLVLSSLLATVSYYAVELPATRWKIYRNSAKRGNSYEL